MPEIIDYDPDPAGQFCGEQIRYGYLSTQFCGEPKAQGLHFCREHHEQNLAEYGAVRTPPGSAVGTGCG